jgi:hypothetical protein
MLFVFIDHRHVPATRHIIHTPGDTSELQVQVADCPRPRRHPLNSARAVAEVFPVHVGTAAAAAAAAAVVVKACDVFCSFRGLGALEKLVSAAGRTAGSAVLT